MLHGIPVKAQTNGYYNFSSAQVTNTKNTKSIRHHKYLIMEDNFPVNTKHLYSICTMLDQCQRRWDDIVQMLYKCFVFGGFDLQNVKIIRNDYRRNWTNLNNHVFYNL